MSSKVGRPRKPLPQRYCEYCGERLVRKEFKSKSEAPSAFAKRKYCDQNCYNDAKGAKKIEIVHGRYTTYATHGCRCGACRAAHAQYQREYMDKNPEQRKIARVRERLRYMAKKGEIVKLPDGRYCLPSAREALSDE